MALRGIWHQRGKGGDMGCVRLCRQFRMSLMAIGLVAGSAMAQIDLPESAKASLLDLTLSEGGSIDPPGDRLVAAILIYPDTDRVDLELGAEAVDEAARPARPASGEEQGPGGGSSERPTAPRPVRARA